jgi:hypothetical protein
MDASTMEAGVNQKLERSRIHSRDVLGGSIGMRIYSFPAVWIDAGGTGADGATPGP